MDFRSEIVADLGLLSIVTRSSPSLLRILSNIVSMILGLKIENLEWN